MKKSVITKLLNILILLIFSNISIFACTQIVSTLKVKTIKGKISLAKDKTALIPGAKVKILKEYQEKDKDGELETKHKLIAETVSDVNGYFAFLNIQKGEYIIKVETEVFVRFWGVVKLKRSNYKKPTKKSIVIYLDLPTDCEAYAEKIKV